MPEHTALHANPFYVLGVSSRDDRRKIVEMAEERSLKLDHELCQSARAALTNPRARLSAEIAWMPGVAPAVAERLVKAITAKPGPWERGLPPLARANLSAAAIELVDRVDSAQSATELILDLASVAEEIDPDDALRDVNEDRAISGFPEITSIEPIEAELAERRKSYRTVLKTLLDKMDTESLVEAMTSAVSLATDSGTTHAPALIDDLAGAYESETQGFLDKERQNINALIKSVKDAAPNGQATIAPLLSSLEKVTRNWSRVARPAQISAKSRGAEHRASRDVAYELRSLGIDLNNEHGMLDPAQRMTELLREAFKDLPEVAERLGDDVDAIADLRRKAEEREKNNAEWVRDITFRADVGMMFKEELAISPDGIQWKGKSHPLESVSRVRWGGVSHSVNGIPTGTRYTIGFGNDRSDTDISLKREATYSGFVAALWRAVCVRLMIENLDYLKRGGSLQFKDLVVEDAAVTLTRHKFFGSNEKVKLSWGEVHVWSADGQFFIGKQDDKKVYDSASYIETWNTHILEQIVRGTFKKGGRKLSDYLA